MNEMPGTTQLVLFALAANAMLGALLVWTAYSGLERSPARAAVTTTAVGAAMVVGNWVGGEALSFRTWTQFELVTLAAVGGAFLGIAAGLLVWRPADERTLPPIDAEQEELQELMARRHRLDDEEVN